MEASELNFNWQAWLQTSFAQHADRIIGDGIVRAEVAYHPHLMDTRRKEKGLRKVEVLLYRVDGSRVCLYPRAKPVYLDPFGFPLPEPEPGQQSKSAFLQSCCTTGHYLGWRQALAWASCALDAMMTLWGMAASACVAPVRPERFPIWRFMAGIHHNHALWLHPTPIQITSYYVAAVRVDLYPRAPARADTTERPCSSAGHSTAGGDADASDDDGGFNNAFFYPQFSSSAHDRPSPCDYVCVCCLATGYLYALQS